jgi:protein-tyrosine phosphatase
VSPFTVLHVCVGNICRSPMAERLFLLALRQCAGDRVEEFYLSHGAGTGAWHEGEPMNPPAARELRSRGADADGFTADAAGRTFVLGEFGRLLPKVDLAILPPSDGNPSWARDRGVALVFAVDTLRGGGAIWGAEAQRRRPSLRADDLVDPWGMTDRDFADVANQIDRTVVPLAAILTGVTPG